MDTKHLKRTVIKETIESKHLEEERSIRIFLPPGFNELTSYPIIYTQDGQDTFMYGRIATLTNYLILEKGMEPVIIVGVDVSKDARNSEYSTQGKKNESYKNFFVEELIPFVENQYEPSQSEITRLLIGDSLGGTVSLSLALDHPELFPYMISLSGAYFEDIKSRLNDFPNLDWFHIWMLVGLGETKVDTHMGSLNFLEWNRNIKMLLEDKQAKIKYVEKEGTHIWGFWQKELPEALLYFFEKDSLLK